MDRLSLGNRVCIAQLDHRGGERAAVGFAVAADRVVRFLVEPRPRGADHLRASPQHRPSACGHGKPVPYQEGESRMTRIAVVGGGAWGTALADLLARKGEQVQLWAREPEVVESINQRHANDMFLPGAPLAPTLSATR